MTLAHFKQELELFLKKHPEALDLEVITSSDDEGNEYNPVHYSISLGVFQDREYTPISKKSKKKPNAVCLN